MFKINNDDYLCMNDKIFNVGIYARLSKEDEEKFGHGSESIKNQIDFLSSIASENGWNCLDIYIDDGLTGTNFERPGFQRMLRDIDSGRINMVITKDLSRLGRDYIQTGYYIEKYFPEKNIRYVAVNDGVDTFSGSSSTEMSPFKNVINDFYARDISRKVRTAIDTKRRSGKFIGSFAPYGYQKDSRDKSRLVPDTETSFIVRRIFNLYAAGYSQRHIAYVLNSEKVPSPARYKKDNFGFVSGKTFKYTWCPETVKKILMNPTYIGSLAQKKIMKISYKSKKIRCIPKDSWIIVPNTHEPIIDKEGFELVQQLLKKKSNQKTEGQFGPHLLSGLIYCGDCGSRMTFLRGSSCHIYAVCSGYKRFKLCSRHSFPENELEKLILKELRQIIIEKVDQVQLGKRAKDYFEKKLRRQGDDLDKEKGALERRLEEIDEIVRSLYEDKVNKVIDEDEFIRFRQSYFKERRTVTGRLDMITNNSQKQEKSGLELKDMNALINQVVNLKVIDNGTLVMLINRIEVFDDMQLTIDFNFR